MPGFMTLGRLVSFSLSSGIFVSGARGFCRAAVPVLQACGLVVCGLTGIDIPDGAETEETDMDDHESSLRPALYIVPTPIGNLNDITLRAIEVLRAVSMIAAEDTRRTQTLLSHLGIKIRGMLACHDHNELQQARQILELIATGGSVALVSDAGMPLISDPGYRVVQLMVEHGVPVIALPGPCAAITALCVSSLPADRFSFAGFLPHRESELRHRLASLGASTTSTIFYESPHRILRSLEILAQLMPERRVVLCRELTKVHETVYRMTAAELYAYACSDADCARGELVLIVAPAPTAAMQMAIPAEAEKLVKLLLPELTLSEACRIASRMYDVGRNTLYNHMLAQRET